jgi:hypothetical protein
MTVNVIPEKGSRTGKSYELTSEGEWLLRLTYVAPDGAAAHALAVRLQENVSTGQYREGPFRGDCTVGSCFDFLPLALGRIEGRRVRFKVTALPMTSDDDSWWRDHVRESHGVVLAATSRAEVLRAHALLAEMDVPLVVALEGDAFTDGDVESIGAELSVLAFRTDAIATGGNTFEPLKGIAKLTLSTLKAHAMADRVPRQAPPAAPEAPAQPTDNESKRWTGGRKVLAAVRSFFAPSPKRRPDYGQWPDARLQELYRELDTLTEEAQGLLTAELARRGLLEHGEREDESANEAELTAVGNLIRRIVSTNMFDFEVAPLASGLEVVLSPIWESGEDGKVIRRAAILPKTMRAHYFEGAARRVLEGPDIVELAIGMTVLHAEKRPLGELRSFYGAEGAPYATIDERWSEKTGSLSLVLADIARLARAGLTPRQMFDGDFESPAARAALARLDSFEMECMREVSSKALDEQLDVLRASPRLRVPPGTTFH